MALTNLDFDVDVFKNVRSSLLGSDGFFAGRDLRADWPLRYVMADATFWDMEIFERDDPNLPFSPWFTGKAQSATKAGSGVRAVINGQRFEHETLSSNRWYSEYIHQGVVKPGRPWNWPEDKMFHIAKTAGRTYRAYQAGMGKPSVVSPNAREAAAYLLPLIVGGISYGDGGLDSKGRRTLLNVYLRDAIFTRGPKIGRPIYGVHHQTNLLFFLVHKHVEEKPGDGVETRDLIELMMDQGVEDAVLGDGSDSTALVVDGVVEEEPANKKDFYIPVGLQLRKRFLTVKGGTTTLAPNTPGSQIVTGPDADLKWNVQGVVMVIHSLGSGLSGVPIPPFPVELIQSGTYNNTADKVILQDAAGTIWANISVAAAKIQGDITFNLNSPNALKADIEWDLNP